MSFCVLDCKRVEHYALPAGLHCQSVVADRSEKALKEQSFSDEPSCPLYGGTGGGHLRVCWVFSASLRTPFRSATIILMSAELPIKRSWLCTSIISWLSMPKSITTQLKNLKQLERPKVFRL
jgi:hypothetical protein